MRKPYTLLEQMGADRISIVFVGCWWWKPIVSCTKDVYEYRVVSCGVCLHNRQNPASIYHKNTTSGKKESSSMYFCYSPHRDAYIMLTKILA